MNLEFKNNSKLLPQNQKGLNQGEILLSQRSLFDIQNFAKENSGCLSGSEGNKHSTEHTTISLLNEAVESTKKCSLTSPEQTYEQTSEQATQGITSIDLKQTVEQNGLCEKKSTTEKEKESPHDSYIEKSDRYSDQTSSFYMVDIGEKKTTRRYAKACGSIFLSRKSISSIKHKKNPKGDVLAMAEIAGIIAAKDTSKLLPLCHTLQLDKVQFKFEIQLSQINVSCEVYCHGKTGVEMEALTGVTTALLTIYDLAKAVDPVIEIGSVYLDTKTGGKSGFWKHPKHSSFATDLDSQINERCLKSIDLAKNDFFGNQFDYSENKSNEPDSPPVFTSKSCEHKAKPLNTASNAEAWYHSSEIHSAEIHSAEVQTILIGAPLPKDSEKQNKITTTQKAIPRIANLGLETPRLNPKGTHEFEQGAVNRPIHVCFDKIVVGLITMSDRASQGIYADLSGSVLDNFFCSRGATIKRKTILPDSAEHLKQELNLMIEAGTHLIAVTGGTGLGPRDITPEVLESIATKKWYGFGEAQRFAGAKHTDYAWASRCAAYICESTLVVLFPGKPKAVSEGLDATAHLIKHALDLISKEIP